MRVLPWYLLTTLGNEHRKKPQSGYLILDDALIYSIMLLRFLRMYNI